MHLFLFQPNLRAECLLSPEESEHCVRVLRHHVGEMIHGIDGKGNYYNGEIIQASKKEVIVKIKEKIAQWGEKKTHIRLVVSPLKQKERFEWLIEKAVELGVNEIIPVVCRRTITDNTKTERLHNLMLAALKQCKRSLLPTLHAPKPFEATFALCVNSLKFIAFCESSEPLQHYQPQIAAAEDLTIFIGPEGDFTQQEVDLAVQNACIPISLGDTRLRTETAGMYALSGLKWAKGF